ncbi:alpha/beta hydrolase [Deinococcus sonorensis]|uniref:Alpha/beta fold hydrolase n=2 Tax=Deinococcus sonorensis TaxID=309891 RepID=A0AAU7UBN7_9DEIO
MAPTVQTVQIGGRQVAYSAFGPSTAPTVLLLPWLGGSRLGWDGVAQALGRSYRVLSPDYRDTGDSSPSEEPYTLPDLADEAAAFMSALGAAPAWVVGLSMGGMVAQHLALRHPELVEGLVLVATTPGGPDSEPATERGRAALFLPAELEAGERARQALALMTAPGFADAHPEALAQAEARGRQHPLGLESFKRQFRAIRAHDTTAQLQAIRVPTLVLHGDHDDLIPLSNASRLASGIPGAQLKVYPATGHMPHLEQPDAFLADLHGFLKVPA